VYPHSAYKVENRNGLEYVTFNGVLDTQP